MVGHVVATGADVERFRIGERVGIPWLGWTCGVCRYCRSERENLCDAPKFTGYQINGGYAEYALADARYCFPIHGDYSDAEAAPLLCAGLIGYRSLRMAGEAVRLGIYGFGAAAHIVAQVARHRGQQVFAFTRPGDREAQAFRARPRRGLGRRLGPAAARAARCRDHLRAGRGAGAGGARAVGKGGVVVAGGIHMSDIPSFPYSILWGERVVRSVANLTRRDAEEFLALAPRVPVRTEVQHLPARTGERGAGPPARGRLRGAAVLLPG